MAKKSGLAGAFYIGGRDISGDVSAINSASSARSTLDVTALDKSAVERLMGLGEGSLEVALWFDDAANQVHDALKGLPTADVVALYAQGGAVGDVAAGLQGKQINYDWSRGQDGSLAGSVQVQASAGVPLEWMNMLTSARDVQASAGNGASKDDAAATSNGAAVILEVVDIASGTPTPILQDSADNAAFATLISFGAMADGTEPRAVRATVAGSVRRYLRMNFTGTFTNIDYAVAYRRGTAQDDSAYT